MGAIETPAPSLSVVVPCYNEEQRLPRTIDRIEKYLDARGISYELILVDDGSGDGTRRVIDQAAAGNRNVRIEALAGKWGVRQTEIGKAVWVELDARQPVNHP